MVEAYGLEQVRYLGATAQLYGCTDGVESHGSAIQQSLCRQVVDYITPVDALKRSG